MLSRRPAWMSSRRVTISPADSRLPRATASSRPISPRVVIGRRTVPCGAGLATVSAARSARTAGSAFDQELTAATRSRIAATAAGEGLAIGRASVGGGGWALLGGLRGGPGLAGEVFEDLRQGGL